MQYRILNRQTLEYKAGGYVASYKIDDDYIVNNNSTITVVKPKSTLQSENVEVRRIVTINGVDFFCYATDSTAYWAIMYSNNIATVFLLSTNPKAVEMWTSEAPDHHFEAVGNQVIDGITYYWGYPTHVNGEDFGGLQPRNSEITNNIYRLQTYELREIYPIENLLAMPIKNVVPRPTDIEYLSNVVTGDIIGLIEDSGAYHKGVITAIDPVAFTISYRSDKELFNDNIPNPMAAEFATEDSEEKVEVAGAFGVEQVIRLLETYFTDKYMKEEYIDPFSLLPLVFEANGDVVDKDGNPRMLWTWKEDSINLVDWLTDLFEKYNLVLSWQIDFDVSSEILSQRSPRYIVTLSVITNAGGIIKDNVALQDITYTERAIPEATVCYVIDSESKQVLMESEGNLLNPATMQASTRLDGKNNTISGNDEGAYTLSDYIKITANKTKDKDDWQTYTLSFWHPYDNYMRWIWCYDKDKTRITGFPYRILKSGIVTSIRATAEVEDEQYNDDSGNNAFSYGFDALQLIKDRTVINGKYANKDGSLIVQKVKNEETGETRDETEEEAEARLARLVKYVRICIPAKYYSNQDFEQLVQLEAGGRTEYKGFTEPAIYYLYDKNGQYNISKKVDDPEAGIRVLPAKKVIASYNTSDEGSGDTTPEETAKAKLIPSQFNQAIEIKINADSKMFDFQYSQFGDQYKIINSNGTIDSVFTGKKYDSSKKWITLLFGLGRQNYTDLIAMRNRKQRYTELFNQGR